MFYSAKRRRKFVLFISGFLILLSGYAGFIRDNSGLAWFCLLSLDLIVISRVFYFVGKGALKSTPEKRLLLRTLITRNTLLIINLINLHLIQLNHEDSDGNLSYLGIAIVLLLVVLWFVFSDLKWNKGPQKSFYAERPTPPIASKG